MADTKRFPINIYGRKFTLCSTEDCDVAAMAKLLNDEMVKVGYEDDNLRYDEVLLLAALNLARSVLDLEADYKSIVDMVENNTL